MSRGLCDKSFFIKDSYDKSSFVGTMYLKRSIGLILYASFLYPGQLSSHNFLLNACDTSILIYLASVFLLKYYLMAS